MRRSLPRLAAVAALAVAFFAGLVADHAAQAARAGRPYRTLDVFSDVLAHVENSYVEEVDEKELVYGAIEGMLARLDPHSTFMRPEAYRAMKEDMSGEFDGLGLEVSVEDGVLTVVSPMADSPGERAGIRPGDRILSIDGTETRELSLSEAVRRMKGAAGTKAVLEVMRAGFAEPQKLTLVRDRVRAESVELRIVDPERRYAVVRLKSFQERTERSLQKALEDARRELGGPIGGLVLDLRNNPGGLLDQAVRVADVFLPAGVIVTTEGRGPRNVEAEPPREKERGLAASPSPAAPERMVEVETARELGTEPGYPLIVLVNKGTASASEVVAGALQDHGRAVIMGTPTFGKGSVQTVLPLGDGSGVKLTIARYYTPKHRSIQELGITPDVLVADAAPPLPAEGPGERDLRRHLKNETIPAVATLARPAGADDYQLRTALDYLRAVGIFRTALEPPRGVAAKRE